MCACDDPRPGVLCPRHAAEEERHERELYEEAWDAQLARRAAEYAEGLDT